MMMMMGKEIYVRVMFLSLFTRCNMFHAASAAAAFSTTAQQVRSGHVTTTTTTSFGLVAQRPPSRRRHFLTLLAKQQEENNGNKDEEEKKQTNPFRFLLHPYESKIPMELRDEIMQAESQTMAAQNRSQRVALYAVLASLGVLSAFFNGFISELRSSTPPPEFIQGIQDSITYSDNALQAQDFVFDLQTTGFGWIESNFITKFLFLNKIGGAICLLGGAAAGLLAEAELDTRRINAEKIYEEMVRRRLEREKRKGGGSSKIGRASNESNQRKKKNKGLSGKERKRMDALTEVVVSMPDDNSTTITSLETNDPTTVLAADEKVTINDEPSHKKQDGSGGGGVLDTIKSFYERADSMAASQALLLNKKLEDAGVLEKITDETGFNVIGKEQAAAAAAAAAAASKSTVDKGSDSMLETTKTE